MKFDKLTHALHIWNLDHITIYTGPTKPFIYTFRNNTEDENKEGMHNHAPGFAIGIVSIHIHTYSEPGEQII